MITIEEMAKELVAVVRQGPMRDTERIELAVRSYEYGLLTGLDARNHAKYQEEAHAE